MATQPTSSRMIKESTDFLQQVRQMTGFQTFVLGVSGGIDSAVSTYLAVRAYGAENVHVVFMQYGDQSVEDSYLVARAAGIPESNIHVYNIKPMVDSFGVEHKKRKGNIMARVRMITLYNLAMELNALVVGTENKTEYLTGYCTRYGDEASDMEPIIGYYKYQVRQLAQALGVPQPILVKAPSAGLWQGQTDENELGFSYDDADEVLIEYADNHNTDLDQISEITGVPVEIVEAVVARVDANNFKHLVPYTQESLAALIR